MVLYQNRIVSRIEQDPNPEIVINQEIFNSMNKHKIDKSAFSIGHLHDGGDEKEYWLSKTPLERIQAIETMRQIIYGYNPSTERLQRFLEITEFKKG